MLYTVSSPCLRVCIVQSYFCYSRHGIFCSVYLCFISRISVYLSLCVICSVYTVSCVQASDGVSRVVRLRARVCPSYMRIRGFLCTRVCVCVFGLRCTPVFSFCQLYARSFCSSLRERVTSKGRGLTRGPDSDVFLNRSAFPPNRTRQLSTRGKRRETLPGGNAGKRRTVVAPRPVYKGRLYSTRDMPLNETGLKQDRGVCGGRGRPISVAENSRRGVETLRSLTTRQRSSRPPTSAGDSPGHVGGARGVQRQNARACGGPGPKVRTFLNPSNACRKRLRVLQLHCTRRAITREEWERDEIEE